MTKQVSFRFACPGCGEPWASPTQDVVDIHAGTTYTCDDCGASIEFTAELVVSPGDPKLISGPTFAERV